MSTSGTTSAPPPRDGPTVGGLRRGARLRTTRAGTWFPASGPDGEPAGLLLLHPSVKPAVLTDTLARLATLRLPGALPVRTELVEQAGRSWLIATAPVSPTVADLLGTGAHRSAANAAALLTEVARTLTDAHAAGLAHGAVGPHAVWLGPHGRAMLAEWGTSEDAEPAADRRAWAELTDLLAERWCADAPAGAAVLGSAAAAARRPGPHGGLDAALEFLDGLAKRVDRNALAVAAATPLTPRRRRRAEEMARRAALVEQQIDDWEPATGPPPVGPPRTTPSLPTPAPTAPPRATPPQPTPPQPTPPRPTPPQPTPPPPPRATDEWALPDPERPPGPARGPAAPRPPRRWAPRPALLVAGVAAALAAGLAVAAAVMPTGPSEPAPMPPRHGPLALRGVQLIMQVQGPICVATATMSTNGQPGRIAYRWLGQNGPQPLSTVSIGTDDQVEVGLVWSPGTSPVRGNTIGLQVLEPTAETTTAEIPLSCI